jgi:hypothetical protein
MKRVLIDILTVSVLSIEHECHLGEENGANCDLWKGREEK